MKRHDSSKRQLRHWMKARLELLRPDQSFWLGERLHENLRLFLASRPGLWATYQPLRGEAHPGTWKSPDHEWVYPRVSGDSLSFHRGSRFVTGPFGIQEPAPDSPEVPLTELAGVICPGLAFDVEGGRLGRGRGFYDRTLAEVDLPRVGLAFSCQIWPENLPMDPWDLRMDAVITEQSVFVIGG